LVFIFFITIFFLFGVLFFIDFLFSILYFSIWFHLIFISDLILMILIFFYPFIITIFQSHQSTFCFILFLILNLVLIILIAIYFILNPFWIEFFFFQFRLSFFNWLGILLCDFFMFDFYGISPGLMTRVMSFED
jgi:hypothetical protein